MSWKYFIRFANKGRASGGWNGLFTGDEKGLNINIEEHGRGGMEKEVTGGQGEKVRVTDGSSVQMLTGLRIQGNTEPEAKMLRNRVH